MATVTAGPNGIDMISGGITLNLAGATVYAATYDTIWIGWSNGYNIVYRGAFAYSGNQLAGGTLTGLEEYYGSTLIYSVANASVSVATYLAYAASNNFRGLIQSTLGGNDTITGAAGAQNVLSGHTGNDTLIGGIYNDTLDGGPGNDTMNGGAGNDTYIVGDAGDTIIDSSGNETVQSWIPYVLPADLECLTLLGSASYGIGNDANNLLIGNDAANILRGGGGHDYLYGGGGNDWLEGETGNDAFAGVAGTDWLYGDAGDDIILGGDGADNILGGSGTDALVGEGGDDWILGGSEWDLIDGRDGVDMLFGEGGGDIIFGDAGADQIDGGDGDDLIMGERGENSLIGDDDTIVGNAGNDMLDGSAGNDLIMGGVGNDIIDGDHGNDRIIGGPGAEIIAGTDYNGVTGRDTFIYQSASDGGDWIYGFRAVAGDSDMIDVRAIFDAAGYAGTAPRSDGMLMIQYSGGNTHIYVDANGPAGGQNWVRLVSLHQTTLDQASLDGYFVYQ